MHILETAKIGNKELRLGLDPDPMNPRTEWDNLGHIAAWHRRYTLADKEQAEQFPEPEDFHQFVKENKGKILYLPIYMYDHSGLTVSTSTQYPFNDRWDAGQIGYIYATFEDIHSEYGAKRITKKLKEKVLQILEYEVKTWDLYLTGQVYAYELVEKQQCNLGCEHENVLDSVCGFYYFNFEDFKKEIIHELGQEWEGAEWT